MSYYNPNRDRKNSKPVKFIIPGDSSVIEVLRSVSEVLKPQGLELNIVREPLYLPYLNTSTFSKRGSDERFVCIISKVGNFPHDEFLSTSMFGINDMELTDKELAKKLTKEMSKKKKKPEEDIELTYDEKVEWFVANYYETGMELEMMKDNMKHDDLDNFFWYKKKVDFPKMKSDLKSEKSK